MARDGLKRRPSAIASRHYLLTVPFRLFARIPRTKQTRLKPIPDGGTGIGTGAFGIIAPVTNPSPEITGPNPNTSNLIVGVGDVAAETVEEIAAAEMGTVVNFPTIAAVTFPGRRVVSEPPSLANRTFSKLTLTESALASGSPATFGELARVNGMEKEPVRMSSGSVPSIV